MSHVNYLNVLYILSLCNKIATNIKYAVDYYDLYVSKDELNTLQTAKQTVCSTSCMFVSNRQQLHIQLYFPFDQSLWGVSSHIYRD